MHHYSFLSIWKIQAPLTAVWDTIYASEKWPDWWDDIEYVIELKEGDENGIGSIREYSLKSPLGYPINFRLELLQNVHFHFLEGKVTGDLSGKGSWRFYKDRTFTVAEINWEVKTTKWWMNLCAAILAPFFKWAHAFVMKKGEKALQRKLEK